MIISDYMRKQSDRVFRNFMIEYKGNHCVLMLLYDFEYSFLSYQKELENCFNFDLNDYIVIDYMLKMMNNFKNYYIWQ